MRRLSVFCGLGILGLALLVSAGVSQDAKKDDKKETKAKGMLPPGFKDLGLSKDQINKIYTIQTEANAKIAELQTKINELKKQRTADEFKVLTDEQREKYLKAKGVETKDKGAKDKATKDNKGDKADKKDSEKDKK